MSFIHPEFLWALALVSVPIIIHLFNFRRFKKEYFSNVSFLKELKQETKKQSRLKKLLILLFRILAVIFLVLAFAQPYLPDENKVPESSVSFIYLDNSFSMEGSLKEGQAFQLAKTKVVELSNYLPANMLYHFLTNDFSGDFQLLQKEELIAKLAKVQLTATSRNLKEIRKRIDAIQQKENIHPFTVYYISDFQSINYPEQIRPLDSSQYWNLIPINQADVDNLYIDSCWFVSPVMRRDAMAEIKFNVVNSGSEDMHKVPVRLLINGATAAVRTIDVNARKQATFDIAFKTRQTGVNRAVLQLDDYPVVFDNELFFTFAIQKQTAVLEVDRGEQPNPYLQALLSRDSLISYLAVSYETIPYEGLDDFHAVVLNALPSFSSGLTGRLEDYVRRGGNLLIFPASGMPENRLNKALGIGEYLPVVSDTSAVSFIQLQHPVFKNVFEKIPSNPDFPTVFKHFPIRFQLGSDALSLIDLEEGDPLLVLYPSGNGNIFQFAVPLEKSFSDFPQNALFVPAVYNSLIYSTYQPPLYYTIGDDNKVYVQNDTYDEEGNMLKIVSWDTPFEYIPPVVASGRRIKVALNDRIKKAGFYNVVTTPDTLTTIAMNYPRQESEFRFLDKDRIAALFDTQNSQNAKILNAVNNTVGQELIKDKQANEWWYWLLLAALFCILVEVLILRFMP